MHTAHDSPLGKTVTGSDCYDPGLLFPIARAPKRAELYIDGTLPLHGADIWNAWELSWLDARGKPQVATATFHVPCDSPSLIESKSLKLYLNSFNETRFDDHETVRATIARDLSLVSGGDVDVALHALDELVDTRIASLAGICIDNLDLDIDHYGPPCPDFLRVDTRAAAVEENLVSHLLKSNCPVTGQPDWASVQIVYRGMPIDRAGLLRYLVSFRRHDDFHEQCVERIYIDLLARCAPEHLRVQARYTRRGGLDINPWRASAAGTDPGNPRLARQ
ncbi:MAG TPA: NADPH-dependent 7-cyano-7-deazaguanine reductase QueF [Dokdonella sp.]|uniref:NADPH-dependent 7-cyano-7-deazaguanine reductase QueF n=1 Tax=Dokdonella sp. TaxID=2291710 RepID=UPI0025C66357|nr:NADPH-dependent 7-cyano-7-deazaguanine reductase QueF [Dokdonella sp.]MBX3691369.1 NADPH-dependent 7-cyano-7-deazaguanine reductase QueF [Dokdonella sp.]MCW5568585.1 NADPH-dependent 7-cyano-7-deazaguanine reductase QueF [Dokdonella sp.]HNR92785.1 NADPH-dependent 7-cyano-7-deazaguanine reductase QueF [Dokdonella sp.]